jgi:glycine/D-amino acid oxidase-like deaminating enzyme
LYLLQALHSAFARRGGKLVNGISIKRIEPTNSGFRIESSEPYVARKIVLSAGLGNAELAPMVGLDAPVKPNRGQVLVTERMQPFLRYPSGQIRQVGEGAVQIGDSKEDVGFDTGTTSDVIARIAKRAVAIYPMLASARVVRTWGALRVMSTDGHPIYDKSLRCPGASLVTCHSGVTLAAAHTLMLAAWIDAGECPDYVERFSAKRFET